MISSLKKQIFNSKIFPNKNFGQNFLINEQMLEKIVSYSAPISNKNILEIGPGLGFLTERILAKEPAKLFSVEIDKRLQPFLEKKFSSYSNFHLICSDAMAVAEKEILGNKANIIANLPYNVSVPLIMKWVQMGELFECMYLLVQKEVAKRIVADSGNKNYGTVSVLINHLAQTEILFDVSPECFFPEPKVDSSFIRISFRQDYKEKLKIFTKLQSLCIALFSSRRKMVRSSFPKISNNWQDFLQKLDLKETLRPEDITREQYVQLANLLNNDL